MYIERESDYRQVEKIDTQAGNRLKMDRFVQKLIMNE